MKKSFRIADHAVLIICGALVIILVYGFFRLVMSFADSTTEHDRFDSLCAAVDDISQDIAELSEYEISQRTPDDMSKIEILPEGDIQDIRDKVFALVGSGFTYRSGAKGECGAYYLIPSVGPRSSYIVRYEKATAGRWLDGSDYCYLIGDSICVTRQ